MKEPFRKLLAGRGVILLDGGLGTMLQLAGLPVGMGPERWNLERPEAVAAVQEAYYRAGAMVVHTSTFGAHPLKMEAEGLGDRMEAINRQAVRTTRSVCPPGRFVAGDIGPTGILLPPGGDGDLGAMERGYSLQAELLAEEGVDLYSVETMYDVEEACAAVRGIRAVSDLPIMACATFGRGPRGFFTMMGVPVRVMLTRLAEAGADAVGANCTLGSPDMVELVEEMASITALPLIAQANAGSPRLEAGLPTYDQGPEPFANDVLAMVRAGARVVGGCCGTTPAFIAALGALLASYHENSVLSTSS